MKHFLALARGGLWSRPDLLRAIAASRLSGRPRPAAWRPPTRLASRLGTQLPPRAPFSGSARTSGASSSSSSSSSSSKKPGDQPPPPSEPDPEPKSFVQAFVGSVRRQMKENTAMKENMQRLSASTTAFAESDTVKRAAEMAAEGAKNTGRVAQGVAHVAGKVGETIGGNEAIQKTVKGVKTGVDTVERVAGKAAEPILRTKIAQTIRSDIMDSSTDHRYVEYKPKALRDAELSARTARQATSNPTLHLKQKATLADPEAGANVTLHKSSKWAESWKSFKENSTVLKSMFSVSRSLEESDSPIMESLRGWGDRIRGIFEETEQAQVIRAIHSVEPDFRIDKWLKWTTEYMIPEVLEAMLKSDEAALKEWCSEATYSVLAAGIAAQRLQGLISDCRLLDIREVELFQAKVLDNAVPVLIVTFKTQEVLLFKNHKGKIMVGKEDAIEHASYAAVMTKVQAMDPLEPLNPRTNGWKVLEMAKHGSHRGV